MPTTLESNAPLACLRPPYDRIHPVDPSVPLKPTGPRAEGEALVWRLGVGHWQTAHQFARRRPPGTALILILPPAVDLRDADYLLRAVESCRPQSILPYHPELDLDELLSVLRRTPPDLAVELMDYLLWRGLRIDSETKQLVRRTVELSDHIRTVSGLARAMYLSRRALGRRFVTRGIPVPSHWLQFARLLRAALRLQAEGEILMSIAYDLGYSDGFALSNQMQRLTGLRPSAVRRALGWEWIVEAWITREVASGGFSSRLHHRLTTPPADQVEPTLSRGHSRQNRSAESDAIAVGPDVSSEHSLSVKP